MKYTCHPDLCLPVPILGADDLPGEPPMRLQQINRARISRLPPAGRGPYSRASLGQGQKYDQFWGGTDQITAGTSPTVIGRVFTSVNTTSLPSGGGGLTAGGLGSTITVDQWTEDWVVVDWGAFSPATGVAPDALNHPTLKLQRDTTGGTVDNYILGQPVGTLIHRMTVRFFYKNWATVAAAGHAPPAMHAWKKLFKLEDKDGNTTGFMYREHSRDGKQRDEFWALLSNYVFPSTPAEFTRLIPQSLGNVLSPTDFIAAVPGLAGGTPITYYVETIGGRFKRV